MRRAKTPRRARWPAAVEGAGPSATDRRAWLCPGSQASCFPADVHVRGASRLAQRVMALLDAVEDIDLKRLRQRVVHPDHAAQPAGALAPDQRVQRNALLLHAANPERVQQQIVCGLAGGTD